MNRDTPEGPETSAQEYSTRRIRFCRDYFCWDPAFVCFIKEVKMDRTKMYSVDFDWEGAPALPLLVTV